MKFLCKFINRETKKVYYRMCYGDTINEGMKEAEKMLRKGFIVMNVTQVI